MRKLRIGIIGAGGIARRKVIPAMRDCRLCDVVAVMNPSRSGEIAAQFGIARHYDNGAALLADREIDAVYIASPVHAHAAQIVSAAQTGKHVLCEKPLTMNVEEAEFATSECAKAGVVLQEGYMMKFHGAHQAIKSLIDQGKLGKLVYLRAQLSCWYPKIPGAWRQDPKLGGGGALYDLATHLFGLLEHFAGPVARLASFSRSHVQDYPVDDLATTLLEFKSGAHATVDVSFCTPDESSKTRLEVYGTGGSVLAEGTIGQGVGGTLEGILGLGVSAYDAGQNKDQQRGFKPISFERVNPYAAQFDYFADCILNGRQPAMNNAAEARHIMDLLQKAYASSRDNRIITLEARS